MTSWRKRPSGEKIAERGFDLPGRMAMRRAGGTRLLKSQQ
jgi:hypothetical protein